MRLSYTYYMQCHHVGTYACDTTNKGAGVRVGGAGTLTRQFNGRALILVVTIVQVTLALGTPALLLGGRHHLRLQQDSSFVLGSIVPAKKKNTNVNVMWYVM